MHNLALWFTVHIVHKPNHDWITTSAAHAQSGIPKRTIIAAINRGDLDAHKLPGQTGAYLISTADLDAWVAGRTARAAS